jgi:hypothetical protein
LEFVWSQIQWFFENLQKFCVSFQVGSQKHIKMFNFFSFHIFFNS